MRYFTRLLAVAACLISLSSLERASAQSQNSNANPDGVDRTRESASVDVTNANYLSGAEVPVTADSFTPSGKTLNITLQFAPAPGTRLMVVRNTGSGIIRGTFNNLRQGETVALSYAGVTYYFVADYHGGSGNDLVLLWTIQTLPRAILQKLDDQIVLALKQSRSQPPFDKPTTLRPDIPVKNGDRVLVDLQASVSEDLLGQIAALGGQVWKDSVTDTSVRAMVPLSQLETLAERSDVRRISPAILTVTNEFKGR